MPGWRGCDDGMDGVLGDASCVGAHGIVGEHGGVDKLDGCWYGTVGGGDEGGAGGNRGWEFGNRGLVHVCIEAAGCDGGVII